MKYLKRILKIVLGLLLIVVILFFVFLGIDANRTSYLKLKNHSNLVQSSYVITNVNVVPMTMDTVLADQSVHIKNGVIEWIGDVLAPEGVEIIKGNNGYLSPGLIDMHVHIWDKQELGLYLANGVTTVRNLWGFPMHLRLKEQIENQELIGPQFFTSSPKLTGKNDYGDDKIQVLNPEKGKELVKGYKQRGYDFIKTYAGMPEEVMNAIIEQSIESEISIAIHPSFNIPYKDQFHHQIATIEHAEDIVQQALEYQLDSTKLESVIQQFVRTKKSFTPTLTGYYKIFEMLDQGDKVLESDFVHYINPLIQEVDSEVQLSRWKAEKENNPSVTDNIYRQHQFHLYILKRMDEAGVNIVCGTDAGIGITTPGFSIHEEIALYKEAGMTNYEALKTATVNPTKTHREFKQIGTIEKGKQANLILTIDNPLDNLSTLREPEIVMIQGRRINKELLKDFTENAYNRKNFVATALRYVEYLIFEK